MAVWCVFLFDRPLSPAEGGAFIALWATQQAARRGARGERRRGKGRRKKKVTKVTDICRSPKKSSYLLHFVLFYRVFGRFVTREVQKYGKKNQKNPSRLITSHKKQECAAPPPPPPRGGCVVFVGLPVGRLGRICWCCAPA
jgi:hypothetical protein